MPADSATDAGYRRRSLWLDSSPEPLTARPPLNGDLAVDVCVVGAGMTGLWTAYYLPSSSRRCGSPSSSARSLGSVRPDGTAAGLARASRATRPYTGSGTAGRGDARRVL